MTIENQMELVSDSAVTRRVNNMGQTLVHALPPQPFQYHFFVVRDETPNAFTIPGAAIYVHTGLLNFVQSDDELAGVLAHEIGHAYLRHPAKGLSRAMGVEYLTGLLFKPNQATQNKFKTMALQLAQGGILNRYGREDERQADETGFYILQKAGYQTDGLLRFLRRLQSLERGGNTMAFLSSHPPTPERIARLEALERSKYQAYSRL